MLTAYIKELLKRALAPTPAIADILPALVAFGLTAYAKTEGITVSDSVTVSILAYLGAFVVLTMVLRLFISAPYAMWRDQVGQVGTLRLELSRPEHIEQRRMARARAKNRVKLAALIREYHWFSFYADKATYDSGLAKLYGRLLMAQGKAGVGDAYDRAFSALQDATDVMRTARQAELKGEKVPKSKADTNSHLIAEDIIAHLHGKMSGEKLALRLVELKKK